ncbi:YceI family protein [Xanthomonas campestris pv. raphani]|uniref:YceI family protein n=1 Tax=Xanthomonas campestris TaxID=339 RepID=UPI002B23A05B|nr:YceI family protein [Xanthomonas campestris]MEA9746153.1 YceI family protein [Xanthomonas campestris pv. raphani]MEA9848278.1 YceI family protein [Xanthomonas campestris pv. raphani]MEA9928516.1 YceI family protein [Xanthomonas campestris pv. raphani]
MTPLARLLAFPALVLTSLAATAAPVRYALDPVHTRVLFAVEHAGFSKALGTVSGSSGTLVFDPDDWAAATLEVTVPLRRADLGDAKWNEATLARNLLDAERFPDAHFVSTKVEASDATHAKVTGNLTLHGVTRPVTLDVTLNALKRHPLPPFRRTAGFSATATLSRAAFGVDAWKSMIGDTVELRIEAEAVREGRADSDDDAGKPTEPAAPEQPTPATTDTESGR